MSDRPDYEKISAICEELKNIAQKYNFSIITSVQQPRGYNPHPIYVKVPKLIFVDYIGILR